MQRTALRTSACTMTLAGVMAATAAATVLAAAPSAQATIQPNLTAGITCWSEAVSTYKGFVECTASAADAVGTTTFTWSYLPGPGIRYYGYTDIQIQCNRNDRITVTLYVSDSAGGYATATKTTTCKGGQPT